MVKLKSLNIDSIAGWIASFNNQDSKAMINCKTLQKTTVRVLILLSISTVWLQSCNYNYYRGMELETKGRFEEANIEYRRAYTNSPGNEKYREAFLRTAERTTADLLERYQKYLQEKKYRQAYRRLEQAQTLSPENQTIKNELRKWFRILLDPESCF